MQPITIAGETFYRVKDVNEFIANCTHNCNIIVSLEFFSFSDKKLVPYEQLVSIEAGPLYDEHKSVNENAKICNHFIEDCIQKIYVDIKDLYFYATVK